MHSAKRISLIGLLLVFLVGNIGVGIFTHSCATSGIEKSFFVQGEDPCDDHHEPKKPKSCCHEECTPAEEVHDDCCSTDVEYVHLSVDQKGSEQDQTTVLCAAEMSSVLSVHPEPVYFQEASAFEKNSTDPPKRQGRKIHKLNQIFVI